jgi:hypothetical protein
VIIDLTRKKHKHVIIWFGELKNLKVPKDFSGKELNCVDCGCDLTVVNQSLDSGLCKNCFMVNLAEIEAEDREEDALSEIDRLKRFLA